ncbi:MAG: glycosyltransferase family 4 protein [Flavobacteriales bacterium]|nr:glycosyltransferase family 4 protein [Flavobacteriales bacterium]
MHKSKIKVLWLCPFPVFDLSDFLKISRKVSSHSSSWIRVLSKELSSHSEIDLHLLTMSQYVNSNCTGFKGGITYHVIRDGVPFTNSGYPSFIPVQRLTEYYFFRRRASRYIQSKIQPDIIHAHGTEGPYSLLASQLSYPYITSIQGILREIVKHESSILNFLKVRSEKKAIESGDFFGCRTDFDSSYVKSINKKSNIIYLPEAMNSLYFSEEWKMVGENNLVFIGTICERKGIFDLIKALNLIKRKVNLKIIGTGSASDTQKLSKMIEYFQLEDSVELMGRLDPQEILVVFKESLLCVLPSHVDNSPNTVAEAQAFGIPVLSTRVGGIPSMISENVTGFLTEPKNSEGLAESIEKILDKREILNEISEREKLLAHDNYYPSKVAEITVAAYRNILSL